MYTIEAPSPNQVCVLKALQNLDEEQSKIGILKEDETRGYWHGLQNVARAAAVLGYDRHESTIRGQLAALNRKGSVDTLSRGSVGQHPTMWRLVDISW